MQRLIKQPKDDHKIVALSTAVTIERKTKPRAVPPSRPQVTRPAQKPVPPRPRVQPRVAKLPEPVATPEAKPTELAKIVPHAPAQQAVPHKRTQVVAQIRAPHVNPQQQMTQQQLQEMQQAFQQTIAMAKAANDPTRVKPQDAPQTMKRAHLDIVGVNELLRRGEGILTVRSQFRANLDGDSNATCYYVDYQINFSDGVFDSGPVYWPICYHRKTDPFYNEWQGFPLPPPMPGWQPSPAEWAVISAHPLLRAYFPGRFPDGQSGN